jgi:hypothetical protein
MLTNFSQKNPTKYLCETCEFKTYNKNDYSRHLKTRKHHTLTHIDEKPQEKSQEKPQLLFPCNCGKVYKYRQSLFEHKKKCQPNTSVSQSDETEEPDISNKELVKILIKENTEFKHMILDILKIIKPPTAINI